MKNKKIGLYFWFLVPLCILLIISLIDMKVFGKTMNLGQSYLKKQTLWFLLGFLIVLFFKFIPTKQIFKYSKWFYIVNILLLILVLFFGKTVNGSKAWFDFGLFSFQPSELMKFTLALFLANYASNTPKGGIKKEFKFILKVLLITFIPSLFVFLEPDTGAIIIYLIIMLAVILIYRIRKRWYVIFIAILLLIIGIFLFLYLFQKDFLIKILGTSFLYRVERILTFVNNDSFQLDRALISIGSSNFFNNNINLYIPEAATDFIVAFTISTLGIWSFIVIISCFFVLDAYFLFLLFKTRNITQKMFIAAFIGMFLLAQIQNIGMNLGLLPIIGLPLPFLSYGGTNTIVYFLFLGVILNFKKN